MKKLMIAAAIVCAAALAQASTVSWTATKNALYNSDESADNYCAYLVDISKFRILDPETSEWTGKYSKYTTAADVAAALKAGTFEGDIIYSANKNNGLSIAGSTTKTVKINVSLADTATTYTKGQVVDYYAILFNNGEVTAADQFLAETPTVVAAQFSDSPSLSVALGPQDGKTWAAIPEPTSGLLLLLGVAGLALRRRRA